LRRRGALGTLIPPPSEEERRTGQEIERETLSYVSCIKSISTMTSAGEDEVSLHQTLHWVRTGFHLRNHKLQLHLPE